MIQKEQEIAFLCFPHRVSPFHCSLLNRRPPLTRQKSILQRSLQRLLKHVFVPFQKVLYCSGQGKLKVPFYLSERFYLSW